MRLLVTGSKTLMLAVYPRFAEHGYVTLHNLTMLVLEYWIWIDTHAESLNLPLDRDIHNQWLHSVRPS